MCQPYKMKAEHLKGSASDVVTDKAKSSLEPLSMRQHGRQGNAISYTECAA